MNPLIYRLQREIKTYALGHRNKLPYVGLGVICLTIYALSQNQDVVTHIYKSEGKLDFKDARILGYQGDSIYEGKERLFAKTVKELMAAQTQIRESNEKLQAKMTEIENRQFLPDNSKSQRDSSQGNAGNESLQRLESKIPPPKDLKDSKESKESKDSVQPGSTREIAPSASDASGVESKTESYLIRKREGNDRNHEGNYSAIGGNGTKIISFPVKDIVLEKTEGIVLPAGSYVKAKLMTGVEAPEGKTYPVLLQLDYAYIIPNKKRLDLSGCFMIVKSQGDLSTERVQMQATKLSCVSKDGRMFEREVNGFIADDKDNSFAVMGSVNSKQDRVAAMAFLSSIVEGVGKSIQQAQTTQQTNALGGSQSIVTGDQMAHMGAGGVSNAAGMVTQWYLKQAQNLLPTINVGSGQDVWIIMQDSVKLPNDYFRKNTKGGASESVYTYFSRISE